MPDTGYRVQEAQQTEAEPLPVPRRHHPLGHLEPFALVGAGRVMTSVGV